MKAELAFDIGRARDLPPSELPEVALVGRSNVGKSSLINALLGRRQLARTSGTPGKTRRVHFYRIERTAYLVDLPGYGYARVSQREQATWKTLVEGYLRAERSALTAALLLVDVRRDWRGEEEDLAEWIRAQGIELRIVLTKSDKLSGQKARARREALARELACPASSIACVSARTGSGLGKVAGWMCDWMGVELCRPDGRKWSVED